MSASTPLKRKRPVNLDLMTIRLPSTAIVSILHRIAGILIFLLMPFMLYGLQQSLLSPEHFMNTQQCIQSGIMKLFIWIFLSSFIYHVVAGVRHLLMDCGIGHTPAAGRKSAWCVFIIAFGLILCLGVKLW